MAFRYQPITGGDLFDVAAQFAEAADARLAPLRDPFAQDAAITEGWNQVIALGWPLSLIAESAGGVGGELADAAALVEGAARFALAAPLIKAIVLVPHLLASAPDLLARIAADEMRPTLVLDAAYPWNSGRPDEARIVRAGDRLAGRALGVELAPGMTHLLIADGQDLLLLPAAADGIDIRRHRRLDGRASADIFLNDAAADLVVAQAEIAGACDLAALFACIEIVAGAATAIEDTIRYLNDRHQFGVALSSFQVLRHYVADMYVAFQNAHATTTAALNLARVRPEAPPWREIALAKLRVGEVARLIAETAIQVHGGMGMTEETRATRIGKRLMLADLEWGDRGWQAERLLGMATELAA